MPFSSQTSLPGTPLRGASPVTNKLTSPLRSHHLSPPTDSSSSSSNAMRRRHSLSGSTQGPKLTKEVTNLERYSTRSYAQDLARPNEGCVVGAPGMQLSGSEKDATLNNADRALSSVLSELSITRGGAGKRAVSQDRSSRRAIDHEPARASTSNDSPSLLNLSRTTRGTSPNPMQLAQNPTLHPLPLSAPAGELYHRQTTMDQYGVTPPFLPGNGYSTYALPHLSSTISHPSTATHLSLNDLYYDPSPYHTRYPSFATTNGSEYPPTPPLTSYLPGSSAFPPPHLTHGAHVPFPITPDYAYDPLPNFSAPPPSQWSLGGEAMSQLFAHDGYHYGAQTGGSTTPPSPPEGFFAAPTSSSNVHGLGRRASQYSAPWETTYSTKREKPSKDEVNIVDLGLMHGPIARRTGLTKFFDLSKGFGFILDDNIHQVGGRDIFVHYTAIMMKSGFRCLAQDEAVEYDLVRASNGGYQALNVCGVYGRSLKGLSDEDQNNARLAQFDRGPRNAVSGVPSGNRERKVARYAVLDAIPAIPCVVSTSAVAAPSLAYDAPISSSSSSSASISPTFPKVSLPRSHVSKPLLGGIEFMKPTGSAGAIAPPRSGGGKGKKTVKKNEDE